MTERAFPQPVAVPPAEVAGPDRPPESRAFDCRGTSGAGEVSCSNDFRQATAILLGPSLAVEGRDPPAGADPPPPGGVEVSSASRSRWRGELKRYAHADGGAVVVERIWLGAEKCYRLTRVGADGVELSFEDAPVTLGTRAITSRILALGASVAKVGAP